MNKSINYPKKFFFLYNVKVILKSENIYNTREMKIQACFVFQSKENIWLIRFK